MKLMKSAATLGVIASLFSSTVATASVTRAGGALPKARVAQVPQQVRASNDMEQQSNLLGAPLFLAFLGAVAITIGTIVVTNNNNDSN